MKIKEQFIILLSFIILIPVICASIILWENGCQFTNRYLIEGYKEVDEIERCEYEDAFKILSIIPSDVKSCLIATDTSKIIYNSIPEIKDITSMDELWETLTHHSDKYFYQFTSPETKKPTILITRIKRVKQKTSRLKNIIKIILICFSVCIIICIVSIIFISKTIFNSIIKIKNETKKIANGNINEAIIADSSYKNGNEIMSILENIEKMRQSLCEGENRKNKFIMGISHDLRNPVAIIKGYTEAITDNVITDEKEIKETLCLIQTKAEQLEKMINDLIDVTKLNNYELKEKLTPSSITDLIKTFAKEAEVVTYAFKRNVICNIDLPDDISIPLNKQLVSRAFENIFTNALRYTKDGDTIKIEALTKDNNILLTISDTGTGIKEEDLPHIFDLFYKSSKLNNGESMGIGLSVVKSIFDTHGWQVNVTSKKDCGTSFTIIIPF